MKKLLITLLIILPIITLSAPSAGNIFRTLLPETDSTYSLGSDSLRWLGGFFDTATTTNLCFDDNTCLTSATSNPAGNDTEVQFNDGGSFGADSAFTWDKTLDLLSFTYGSSTDQTISGNSWLGTILSGTWNGTPIDFSDYTNATAGTNITFTDDAISVTDPFSVTNGTITNASSTQITASDILFTGATQYDTGYTPSSEDVEGQVWWNDTDTTLNISTGTGSVWQVNQEDVIVVYNDTGSQINDGTAIHPIAGVTNGIPHVEPAQSFSHEELTAVIWVATGDIPDGQSGFAISFGKARGIDTSMFGLGDTLYIATSTDAGELNNLTNTRPEFPNYAIPVGGITAVSDTDGELFVQIGGDVDDTFENTWNGGFREQIKFTVTSDGATITGSLENGIDDTLNLTMIFSDGLSTLDSTPATTTPLTAGTATNPQINYIYIPKSTKILTVSTSDWPTTEHIKIADVKVFDATTTQTYGAFSNRNWNDHLQGLNGMGHLLHIAEKLRSDNADWKSGTEETVDIQEGGASEDDVYISVTSGKVYQLHEQDFSAFDTETGDVIFLVNDATTPYDPISNLNVIDADANGDSLIGEGFSLVLGGICNSGTEPDQLFINLPSGSYSGFFTPEEDAIQDPENYANYSIPENTTGKAFLIAKLDFEISNNGLEWTLLGSRDLRGSTPGATGTAGGGGTGVTTFTGLTDTPASYSGQANNVPTVNAGETGLEFDSFINDDGTRPLTGDWDAGSYQITAKNFVADDATATSTFTDVHITNDLLVDGQIYGSFTFVTSGDLQVDNIKLSGNTIEATDDGGLFIYDNASNGITVENGGNIGIGTTGPGAKLDVNGTTRLFAPNDGSESLKVWDGSNIGLLVENLQSGTGIIVKQTGNVGIGTSNPTNGKVQIYNTSNQTGLFIQNTIANEVPIVARSGGTGSTAIASFQNDSGEVVKIQSNGNVGIGTTGPSSILNINGTIGALTGGLSFGDGDTGFYEQSDDALRIAAGGTDQIYITNGYMQSLASSSWWMGKETASATNPSIAPNKEDTDTGIGWVSADKLSLIAGGTGAMTITGGNVGIGTTAPAETLVVGGAAAKMKVKTDSAIPYVYSEADAGDAITIWANGDANQVAIGANRPAGGTLSSGDMVFSTFADNWQEEMRLTNNGNLGIGTTNPESLLEISGAGSQHLTLTDSSAVESAYFGIMSSDGNLYLSRKGTGGEDISVQADGDVILGQYGNVGIGTTNPTDKLHVVGDAYFSADVSALSFTDRTPYPKDLQTAYDAVMSMQRLPDGQYQENNKEHQLDHSKLSNFIKSGEGRDLSATVSAQNEVIKDLVKRIEELEAELKNN